MRKLRIFIQRNYAIILVMIITTLILAFTVNTRVPYEQDQPSKAAQILVIASSNHFLNMSTVQNLYDPTFFSFYFILSSLFYKVFGGDIIRFMNIQAVFCGVITAGILYQILKKKYKVNPFISLLVLVSMPNFVISFTYGNEINYALLFFSLSLLFIIVEFRYKYLLASLFFTLSVFSRPEFLLLFPFWLGWLLVNEKNTNLGKFRLSIRVILYLFIFATTYWLVFLRVNPIPLMINFFHPSKLTETNSNWKLVLSYLSYPFNLSIVLLGAGGLIWFFRNKRAEFFVLITLLIPVLYKITILVSPKYVISLILFFGITASVLLSMMKPNIRFLSIIGILFWWVFSLSPYAFAGPGTGEYYVVPTADGNYPTGSYLTFYSSIKEGFYQAKYKANMESALIAANKVLNSPEKIYVLNQGNESFFALAVAELDIARLDEWKSFCLKIPNKTDKGAIFLMLNRDYLFENRIPKALKDDFSKWIKNGQVLSLEPGTVFPKVIQIGDSVSPGNDLNLTKRIEFAYSYYHYGIFKSDRFSQLHRATSWIPTSESKSIDTQPLYCDSEFCAYDKNIPDSEIWMLELPYVYLGEQDINAR